MTKESLTSKHNRISRRYARLAQSLHALEELFFTRGQNIARGEYRIHFPQPSGRIFDRDPVASVSPIVNNHLQQDRNLRPRLPLQSAQELSQMLGPRDVAQTLGNEETFVLS